MSDDLQSGGIQSDIGADTGQSAESTNAASASTSSAGSGSASTASSEQPAATSVAPKTNWYDDPEYRKMQAERDRREAQLRKENEALKRQQEEIHLSGMDDLERAQYERDKAAKQAQEMATRLEEIELIQVRSQQLQELSKKYGVPVDVLEDARDPVHARELVIEYKDKMKAQRAAEVQGKEQRNAGHLDRGAPVKTDGPDWYLSRKDAKGFVKSLMEK